MTLLLPPTTPFLRSSSEMFIDNCLSVVEFDGGVLKLLLLFFPPFYLNDFGFKTPEFFM